VILCVFLRFLSVFGSFFFYSFFGEYVAKKAPVGFIRYIVTACHYARSTLYVSINNFLKFEPLTQFGWGDRAPNLREQNPAEKSWGKILREKVRMFAQQPRVPPTPRVRGGTGDRDERPRLLMDF